jgi:hypothetical protein
MHASTARHHRRGQALVALALGVPLVMGMPGAAVAHDKGLDHPAPAFAPSAPLSTAVNSGGEGADWELVTSIPTGNPHTDIDFFTQGGESYAAVGTLAAGPNGGGQSIVQLTEGGEVDPSFLVGHPSAACVTVPASPLGCSTTWRPRPRAPR